MYVYCLQKFKLQLMSQLISFSGSLGKIAKVTGRPMARNELLSVVSCRLYYVREYRNQKMVKLLIFVSERVVQGTGQEYMRGDHCTSHYTFCMFCFFLFFPFLFASDRTFLFEVFHCEHFLPYLCALPIPLKAHAETERETKQKKR